METSMRLTQLEGMVVGDDDLGLLQVVQHIVRHEFTAGVVAVGWTPIFRTVRKKFLICTNALLLTDLI